MLGWLYHRMIARMERRYAYDATYLHELADGSPEGFRRFMKAQMAGRYRGRVPADAWFAASMAGAMHEDCGPCVQISTDMALEAGVAAETVTALLDGTRAPADVQIAHDYGRALLAGDERLDGLRDAIITKWGLDGLAALSFAAMYSRNYPVMKRAMGYAKACQRIRVGDVEVSVAKAA